MPETLQQLDTPLTANEVLTGHMGVFLSALVAALVATPIIRWLAIRNGIVDWPDLKRKNHIEPVAYLGGVAILIAWLCGIFFSYFATPQFLSSLSAPAQLWGLPLPIVFGATVITLTGLMDDVYDITPRVKIGGQFMAAAAMALSSQSLGSRLAADVFAAVGWSSCPPSVIYASGAILLAVFVLGGCNSMNLLDGLDGLATGVAAITSCGLLFIAVSAAINAPESSEGAVRVVMCLAILGALLGFLPYNFNPANIFMGDAGSLLVGYLCVSTILLFASAGHGGTRYVMGALIVYALPITDTLLAISRRVLQGRSISTADDQHLHHVVLHAVDKLRLGPNASVKITVIVMYTVSALFAVLGCSLVFLRIRYATAVFLTLFGFLVVGAYKSGHRRALLAKLAKAEGPTPDTTK